VRDPVPTMFGRVEKPLSPRPNRIADDGSGDDSFYEEVRVIMLANENVEVCPS